MTEQLLIQPKRPNSADWRLYDTLPNAGYMAERWISKHGHTAITAVEVAETDIGPEYHVSVSFKGGRVPADEVPSLLKLWDMEGADEDNHVKGIARHFWKPVATSLHGYVCPCKAEEPAIIEGDYVWRPLEGK